MNSKYYWNVRKAIFDIAIKNDGIPVEDWGITQPRVRGCVVRRYKKLYKYWERVW